MQKCISTIPGQVILTIEHMHDGFGSEARLQSSSGVALSERMIMLRLDTNL